MPHFEQTRNSAVLVPNVYWDTSAGFWTATFSEPVEQDVQTPPRLMQKEQPHARAGISIGSGFHKSVKVMFPQWQRPEISIVGSSSFSASKQPLNFPHCVLSAVNAERLD
jgi:hypothetical protein